MAMGVHQLVNLFMILYFLSCHAEVDAISENRTAILRIRLAQSCVGEKKRKGKRAEGELKKKGVSFSLSTVSLQATLIGSEENKADLPHL